MSSHHFVKEGQEPALLILDALTFDIAGPLLEWVPLVVVAQPAIDQVLLWNIKIDVVLTKEIHVNDISNGLSDQTPLTILRHSREESPLISGLNFLISKQQSAVNIFSASAMTTMATAERFADKLQINVMDGTLLWSAIATGHFEKWMSAGTITFLKGSLAQQSIGLHGLKEVDDHFESLADGIVRLESDYPFWIGALTP